MKARQKFTIFVDKAGNRVHSGKELTFDVGDEVPDQYLVDLLRFNAEYIDVKMENEKPVLTEEQLIKYNFKSSPKKEAKQEAVPEAPKKTTTKKKV